MITAGYYIVYLVRKRYNNIYRSGFTGKDTVSIITVSDMEVLR